MKTRPWTTSAVAARLELDREIKTPRDVAICRGALAHIDLNNKSMNDRKRINLLASLFATVPSAKVKYRPGDEDSPCYTISVEDSCLLGVKSSGPTFRKAVDNFDRDMKRAIATA